VKLLQLFDILKTYYVFKMSNNTIALRLLHLCGTHREVYLRSPPSVRARLSRDDHRSEDEPVVTRRLVDWSSRLRQVCRGI